MLSSPEERRIQFMLNLEPTYAALLRRTCAALDISYSSYLRMLVLVDLRKRDMLTVEHMIAAETGENNAILDELLKTEAS